MHSVTRNHCMDYIVRIDSRSIEMDFKSSKKLEFSNFGDFQGKEFGLFQTVHD